MVREKREMPTPHNSVGQSVHITAVLMSLFGQCSTIHVTLYGMGNAFHLAHRSIDHQLMVGPVEQIY